MSAGAGKRSHKDNIFGPMPMSDYVDYDDYWKRRDDLGIMYRWTVAMPWIEDGAKVLDVGCGSGEFVAYLQQEKPGCEVSGADISQVAVDRAIENGFTAYRLDLPASDIPHRYDVITAFEVIEHIGDAEAAVTKMMEHADRLVISIPNVGYFECRLRLLFGRFPLTRCQLHIKEHIRHWTTRDFREWVAALGLKVVHEEPAFKQGKTPSRQWPSMFSPGELWVLERA